MTECDADTELLSLFTLSELASSNDNYEKQEIGVDKAEIRRVC